MGFAFCPRCGERLKGMQGPEQGLALPSYGELLEKWNEGSAYGDHVPKQLPRLIAEFLAENGVTTDAEKAWEIICEATPEDSWQNLFECIFTEGARYAFLELEDRGMLPESRRVTDICVCHLPYQSAPFVIGTIRDPKSPTGESNVWLCDDGKWTRNEIDPRISLKIGGWDLPNVQTEGPAV